MTTLFTKRMGAALTGLAIVSSCSRPVAYFQRGPVDPSVSPKSQLVATPSAQASEAPAKLLTQVNTTVSQLEAYVRSDNKLATDEKLSKRMVRVKNLLTSTHETLGSKTTYAPHKMNVVERLMIKRMNKQIGQQIAPNNPEKALVKQGQLIGGLVLLIVGLLLLILGTGTVAFIGLIVSLVGALGVIISVLGIDS